MQPEALIDKAHITIEASLVTLGTNSCEEVKILVISQLGQLLEMIQNDPEATYVIDPSLIYDISCLIEHTYKSIRPHEIKNQNLEPKTMQLIIKVGQSAIRFNDTYRKIKELR